MADPTGQTASGVVDPKTSTPATLDALRGVFQMLLAEHGQAFALVKQLGARSDTPVIIELQPRSCLGRQRHVEPFSHARGEMAEGYAALKAVVKSELLWGNDARGSDLADAMAALDAMNPGSPEWGPTFLQVSELVQAHAHQKESEASSKEASSESDEQPPLQAAC